MDAQRRRAVLAIAPLGMIALGLFVPPVVHTRPHVQVISPWDDGWQLFWWVHLAAGALAALAALAAWRNTEPGHLAVGLAGLGIAACAYAPAMFLRYTGTALPALSALFVTELVGCAVFLVLAWRARGWTRWMRLLGAYACAVVYFGCPLIVGLVNAFSGGVTFLAALSTLVVLVARSVR